jgi:hypothetical protein
VYNLVFWRSTRVALIFPSSHLFLFSVQQQPSIIMIRSLLLTFVSLVTAVIIVPTDASIAYNPIVTCQTLAASSASAKDVCATYSEFQSSTVMLPNGTSLSMGPTGYNFQYWNNVTDGTDTSTLDASPYRQVQVFWQDNTCQVQIDNVDCSSCSMCSSNESLIRADCTNVPGGRLVDPCEPAFVFYPLQLATLSSEATTTAATSSSTASTNKTISSGIVSSARPVVVAVNLVWMALVGVLVVSL